VPVIWVLCAVVIIGAALRARDSAWATRVGELGVAVLYLVAGALVNVVYLVQDEDYADFAEQSYIPFVRDTWESLVVPNHELFIGLLVAFELVVGLLALAGGRYAQVGLAAAAAFHVALLSFGWWFYAWSLPILAALVMLLLAERHDDAETEQAARRLEEVYAGRIRPHLH